MLNEYQDSMHELRHNHATLILKQSLSKVVSERVLMPIIDVQIFS